MKKIIDGKRYDTETARYIGGTEFSHTGDFRHREKSIYCTKNGQYFRYDSGGAMTDMSVSCGNNWTTGSEKLELISKEIAFQKLQEWDVDACEKEFGKEIQEG